MSASDSDIEIGSTWSKDGEVLAIVDITETDVILLAPLEDIKAIRPTTRQLLLDEWEFEEAKQSSHEVMVDIAETRDQIEPLAKPDYWLELVVKTVEYEDEEKLLELIESIIDAGRALGTIDTIGKKFALDQDWIDDLRETLGMEEKEQP